MLRFLWCKAWKVNEWCLHRKPDETVFLSICQYRWSSLSNVAKMSLFSVAYLSNVFFFTSPARATHKYQIQQKSDSLSLWDFFQVSLARSNFLLHPVYYLCRKHHCQICGVSVLVSQTFITVIMIFFAHKSFNLHTSQFLYLFWHSFSLKPPTFRVKFSSFSNGFKHKIVWILHNFSFSSIVLILFSAKINKKERKKHEKIKKENKTVLLVLSS